MKILYLLFIIANSEKIIRNINTPSCMKCIHYKPSYYSTNFLASYNNCNKFGNKDIITDKISYDNAESCRSDEKKCGYNGNYFEEEKNLGLKIFTHQLITNIPNISSVSLIVIIIITNIYRSK